MTEVGEECARMSLPFALNLGMEGWPSSCTTSAAAAIGNLASVRGLMAHLVKAAKAQQRSLQSRQMLADARFLYNDTWTGAEASKPPHKEEPSDQQKSFHHCDL